MKKNGKRIVIYIQEVYVDALLYGIENGDFRLNSDIFEAVHQFIQDRDTL